MIGDEETDLALRFGDREDLVLNLKKKIFNKINQIEWVRTLELEP